MVLIARDRLSGLRDRQYLRPVPAVAALFYPAALPAPRSPGMSAAAQ
jgi:hypothetical protein